MRITYKYHTFRTLVPLIYESFLRRLLTNSFHLCAISALSYHSLHSTNTIEMNSVSIIALLETYLVCKCLDGDIIVGELLECSQYWLYGATSAPQESFRSGRTKNIVMLQKKVGCLVKQR